MQGGIEAAARPAAAAAARLWPAGGRMHAARGGARGGHTRLVPWDRPWLAGY
jgi:hypothetical protein